MISHLHFYVNVKIHLNILIIKVTLKLKLIGRLRYIKKLTRWSPKDVLIEKYDIKYEEATSFSSFLIPMLQYDPNNRARARDMLNHSWLKL